MRKISLFLLLLIVFLGIFYFIINGINEESVYENETINESNNESNGNTRTMKILSNYEDSGKECKLIEEVIERGDCFQTVNEKYLSWYLEQSKVEFYFPFQQDQENWEDVFYYSVDKQDTLEKLNETDYFDDYVDPYGLADSETNHQRGMETVQEYWHIFSNMIPQEYRTSLKSVYWTDTGEDLVLGVGRDETNMQDTVLMLSHNIGEYHPTNKYTFIHEFAHVLTLNEEQIKIDEQLYNSEDVTILEDAKASCSTHFVTYGWGCMNESSYLNNFYHQFWDDIYGKYNEIDWESEDDYKEFFFAYEDRFFNSYQGTNPEEDIAESFTYFVKMDREELEENTQMKYEKINFFYQYDELVELRTQILENIYDISIEDGEFY
ncbi:hypothetical protein ACFSTA_09780 [Ornithinibacillus salinisoli]|uniref:Uncharacterized protein n=1 Tax=Ornithinibacillus salinisoli TaxID=1848459 RepID=A0ABW4W0V3_9BACI